MDIVEVIRGRAALFESLAHQNGIRFSIIIPDEPVIEWFDRDCVEKIVTNLLSNAFKFTDKGGTVTLSLRTNLPPHDSISSTATEIVPSSQFEIKVTDTGIGIHPEQLDKIFNRFYQADTSPTREREGTGIGLSVVKDIVKLCTGEITVTSEPGKGSTFTVRLPLSSRDKNPEQIIETSEKKSEQILQIEEAGQSKAEVDKKINKALPRLLIVEDNSDMRKYFRMNLSSMYAITEAVNGIEGLEKAIDEAPDLIISDVMMPGMDGIEFCRRLKTNWETSHIPIILLTAKASNENKIEGLETGADDYLTKPFNLRELFIRVKNLLEQRKRLKEKFSKEIKITADAIASNSLDNEFLNRAFTLAEKNLSNTEFDSNVFSKEMFVSRSQLHRKLQAITGHSPGEFIRSFRLKHAAQMLLEKRYNVAEVAFKVGFHSPSHFTKAFRHQFSCLPSEFTDKV